MIPEASILAVPVSAHDHTQGNAHAVVTLVEYGDFQCPACGMACPAVKQIQRRYAGNLRFVFREKIARLLRPAARCGQIRVTSSSSFSRFAHNAPCHERSATLSLQRSNCSQTLSGTRVQPNCTVSIEIEPPSMPSTGNVTASPSSLAPSTYSSGR